MCGHTQVRDVWYRCWYMWAQPGGSVGKSRPFPAPQPPLPLVNHNWCARPFRNMTCVCSWGKPKHQREKKRQNWADDCMTILHFLMQLDHIAVLYLFLCYARIHQVDHLRQRRWFVNVQFSSVERIVLERVVERVHITFRSD